MKFPVAVFIMASLLVLGACAGGNTGTSPARHNGPAPKADEILGKGSDWLLGRMGRPHFVRAEAGAEIWQYQNEKCVLNFFVYRNETDAGMRVLHFDGAAIDKNSAPLSREKCLRSF